MKFTENNTRSSGRPKNSKNSITQKTRQTFDLLLENNLSKLQIDIDNLKSLDRIKVILELAKFVIPTLKSVDITEAEKTDFQPITINFTKSNE